MSAAECARFEKKLAYFSAPSLLGIKCANLISIGKNEFNLPEHIRNFNTKAAKKGLRLHVLCACKSRALILLYNASALEQQLKCDEVCRILEAYGYKNATRTEEKLKKLAERIQENPGFPHEIGVFLGYPPEDVIGFIQNRGENYQLCGYWKVYSNAEKAARTFQTYDKCRNFLCNKLNQGYDIYQALRIS